MNSLYVSGFGVSLSVDRARLIIKDGFLEPDSDQRIYEIQPRNSPYDSVVIDGHTGSISITAIKWLMRHGVPLFILDYNGTLLASTLPRESINGPLKVAQIETYKNPRKRFYIATLLIAAKAQRTLDVLNWLGSRYSGVDSVTNSIQLEMKRINKCDSLPKLMQVEGHIADLFWRYLQGILPKKFGFTYRLHESRPMNASDPINVLLNYGYAILETQCRKALNCVGLESSVGFLHEPRQTKYSLCYDLMEPYRFLADTTVIECLEYDRFSRKDFYRLDNYVLRLRPEAVRKLLDALRIKFNSPVRYQNKFYGWDVIMRLKAQELAAFILNKQANVSFEKPVPVLQRDDSETLRIAILSMSAADTRRLGIRRNTLWYLKDRARSRKPLTVYKRVRTRILRDEQRSLTD